MHRIDGAVSMRKIINLVPSWLMAPAVEAYLAMPGVSFVVAVTFGAEGGDVGGFDTPSQRMTFLLASFLRNARPEIVGDQGRKARRRRV
jgi:hypothetical protein